MLKTTIDGTDIPRSDFHKTLVVQPEFQPGRSFIVSKSIYVPQADEHTWKELLGDVLNLNLRHLGTFEPDNIGALRGVQLRGHQPCGGMLKFSKSEKHNGNYFSSNYVIRCSGKCRSSFEMDLLDVPDIGMHLLHLLLKQMAPNLPSANYFDCTRLLDYTLDRNSVRPVAEWGLLAVWCYGLKRIHRGSPVQDDMHYHFGITAYKGLCTREGCDGFDEWFQFLLAKQYEMNKRFWQMQLAPQTIGPRPRTERR